MANLESSGIWNLIQDTFDESGLSLSIPSDKSDFLSSLDCKIDIAENHVVSIILPHVFAYDRIVAASHAGRKFQMH